MFKIFIILLFFFFHYNLSTEHFNEVDYLERYGYLNNKLKQKKDLKNSMIMFQKRFGLEPNGVLDAKTKELMKTPRCQLKDSDYNLERHGRGAFEVHNSRWSRRHLGFRIHNWPNYFLYKDVQKTFSKALSFWSDVTEFSFDDRKTIGNSPIDNTNDVLDISFEKTGRFLKNNEIARTAFPIYGGDMIFNLFPHWFINNTKTKKGLSLLQTAIHEAGHSLGLKHSYDKLSIMFPYQRFNIFKHNLAPVDIIAIQSHYPPYMCRNSKIDTVLNIDNKTLYFFKDDRFWTLKIQESRIENRHFKHKGQLIKSKWPQLPPKIDAAIQYRSAIYFFSKSKVWKFNEFNQLEKNYPRNSSIDFEGLPSSIDSIAVLNGNLFAFKGQKFWSFNKTLGKQITHSLEILGIHKPIDAALSLFGMTYLFQNNVYYKFSDFKLIPSYPKSIGRHWFQCLVLASQQVHVNYQNDFLYKS